MVDCHPDCIKHTCNSTTTKINPIKKWTKDLNKHFSEEGILMFSKHMKRCLTLGSIRGIQIKTKMRYHFTSLRMIGCFFLIYKKENKKRTRAAEDIEMLDPREMWMGM